MFVLTCFKCDYARENAKILIKSNFRLLNDHLFGKELFIRFTARAFRKLPSIYVFSYFPFGFEDMMWDPIVSVPDHAYLFTLQIRALVVVPGGGPKKSPRTFI